MSLKLLLLCLHNSKTLIIFCSVSGQSWCAPVKRAPFFYFTNGYPGFFFLTFNSINCPVVGLNRLRPQSFCFTQRPSRSGQAGVVTLFTCLISWLTFLLWTRKHLLLVTFFLMVHFWLGYSLRRGRSHTLCSHISVSPLISFSPGSPALPTGEVMQRGSLAHQLNASLIVLWVSEW